MKPGAILFLGFLAIWGVTLAARAQAEETERLPTVGVMEFSAKGGVEAETAEALLDVLAQEIGKLGSLRVITWADIVSMLKLEKMKRLAGCTDEECFANLATAVGVNWLVSGNISRFGRLFVLNLKLMDVKNVMVVGRVTRQIRGDQEDVIEEIPGALRELFAPASERLGLNLQQQVTIATRYPKPLSESPSAVWVITREDIEASGADSIPNLLRLVPGMDVVVSTSAKQSITSRLLCTDEGNQYLVLIDGREVNWEMVGFPIWEAQPIFIEDIERIEVVRGPASAIFGANAFGGVVNIITRQYPERATGNFSATFGEAGRKIARLNASAKLLGFNLTASAGMDMAGEYLDPEARSKRVWKFRLLAERRWSQTDWLSLDVGIAPSEGLFSSPIGVNDFRFVATSMRLGAGYENIRGQLFWLFAPTSFDFDADVMYGGLQLASFVPTDINNHVLDAQLEWKLPSFWTPLTILAGTSARLSWAGSDQLLDARTFSDPQSTRYHLPGVSYWDHRFGLFLHSELAAAEWLTVTAGVRLDYSAHSDWFASPRLAAVLQLANEQYLRFSVARSFRKPSLMEEAFHPLVKFPPLGPIQGDARTRFLEFMTRVGGNSDLENEELLAFEIGWLGRFLKGRLTIGLDAFYNRFRNWIIMVPRILEDENGLPDLLQSSFMNDNEGPALDILGGELYVQWSPEKSWHLLASWTHRQAYDYSQGGFSDELPNNLFTLGGRFSTSTGLIGSLYAFYRSALWDNYVDNPAGILEPRLSVHLGGVMVFMGRFGQRFALGEHGQVEGGIKLFLPVSFSSPHFRYYEAGGGITPDGKKYGAEQLGRVLSAYLQGAF